MTVLVIPPGTTWINDYEYQHNGMTEVVIPDGVEAIGFASFKACADLQTVILPDSITKIDSDAFKRCTSLKTVIIPDGLTKIEWSVFRECFKLQTVILPNSVTIIEWCAFRWCSSLQNLTIPANLLQIDDYAFGGCSGLQTVTIPASVIKIRHWAFYKCLGLQRIWNKSKCELDDCDPWVYLRGETPPLKQLEKWTFALHWHWRYPDRITPEQARRFTTGLHCLAVPTELCQTVFSYIPRA
jgi:hypothetical protein